MPDSPKKEHDHFEAVQCAGASHAKACCSTMVQRRHNSINIDYKSKNPLRKLQVLIGEKVIQEIDIENEKS